MMRIQHWIIWLLTAIWQSAKWLVTATWRCLKCVARTAWSGVQALAKVVKEVNEGLQPKPSVVAAASYRYHWWKNPPSRRISTHIGRYDNAAKMDAEIAIVSTFGWVVKHVATFDSHINVGRTVAPMVLTGGLSLLKGASRTKERYIVTFEHDGRIAEAA